MQVVTFTLLFFFGKARLSSGCSGSGDYVELLGGNGVDTSRMFPVADLCFPLSGLGKSIICSTVNITSWHNQIQTLATCWQHIDGYRVAS